MSFVDQPDSTVTSTMDLKDSPCDLTAGHSDSTASATITPETVQLTNVDSFATTATPMVVSVKIAPTALETEAANILTTIRNGELVLPNGSLHAAAGSRWDNIIQYNSGPLQYSDTINDSAKSLSNELQTSTFKMTGNASERTQELDPLIAKLPSSTMVKSNDSGTSFMVNNIGIGSHLDALAEAAASATYVLPDLTSTMTTSSASSQPQSTNTAIKFFDANSKQSFLNPTANSMLNNSSNGNVLQACVTTTAITTTTSSAINDVTPMTKANTKEKQEEESHVDNIENRPELWSTVGIFQTPSHTVFNFVYYDKWNCLDDGETLSADNLPDLANFARINLEPDSSYRFRVAAINSAGRGEWSDVETFKTLPCPGAPSDVKVRRIPAGAHLSWKPSPGTILYYTVLLAVNWKYVTDKAYQATKLPFVTVYCGRKNECTVPTQFLSMAQLDFTSSPAIVFRIMARDSNGNRSPFIQVRWVQNLQSAKASTVSGIGSSTMAMERASVNSSMTAFPNKASDNGPRNSDEDDHATNRE